MPFLVPVSFFPLVKNGNLSKFIKMNEQAKKMEKSQMAIYVVSKSPDKIIKKLCSLKILDKLKKYGRKFPHKKIWLKFST